MEKYAGLQGENMEICAVEKPHSLLSCMEELHRRKIGSLIVEGGTELHQSFIKEGLWDEIRILQARKVLGGGYPPPELPQAIKVSQEEYDGEKLSVYRNMNRTNRQNDGKTR